MTKNQPQQQYAIGMVGLGVMGRNLVLNMADHGFFVAGYDKDPVSYTHLDVYKRQPLRRATASVPDSAFQLR